NAELVIGERRFRFGMESIAKVGVRGRLISECDTVFHRAAAVGVDLIVREPIRVIETNVGGSEIVLKTARRYRKKVMLASTSEVYGKSELTPFGEDHDSVLGTTTKSRWAYAASKALDEFLALAYYRQESLPVVVFRLLNTVGPRQRGRYGMVIPRFVSAALAGKPIQVFGDGQQTRCFCNVSDAIRGIVALSQFEPAVGQV